MEVNMSSARSIIRENHPTVDRWSISSYLDKKQCYIVDAIEPVKYCYAQGHFWKKFSGNPKKYPLVSTHKDKMYFCALLDISTRV